MLQHAVTIIISNLHHAPQKTKLGGAAVGMCCIYQLRWCDFIILTCKQFWMKASEKTNCMSLWTICNKQNCVKCYKRYTIKIDLSKR